MIRGDYEQKYEKVKRKKYAKTYKSGLYLLVWLVVLVVVVRNNEIYISQL